MRKCQPYYKIYANVGDADKSVPTGYMGTTQWEDTTMPNPPKAPPPPNDDSDDDASRNARAHRHQL